MIHDFCFISRKASTLNEQWEGDDKNALFQQLSNDYKIYDEFYNVVNDFINHLNNFVIPKTEETERKNIERVENRG